jgi:hypothetical protein
MVYFDVLVGPLGEKFRSILESDLAALVVLEGCFLRFLGCLGHVVRL